jgi:hypothetical protein
MAKTKKRQPTRAELLILAAETGADLRTVRKAFASGLSSVRGEALRERLTEVASRHGVEVPS